MYRQLRRCDKNITSLISTDFFNLSQNITIDILHKSKLETVISLTIKTKFVLN